MVREKLRTLSLTEHWAGHWAALDISTPAPFLSGNTNRGVPWKNLTQNYRTV